MSIEVPLFRQRKSNTCALACLRMVLAAYDSLVAEKTLENLARMEPGGTLIEEVERLAREYGLEATIQETSLSDLQRLLKEGKLAIAYIDRSIFELKPGQRSKHSLLQALIHAVIPVRVTRSSVFYHDPLPPSITRRSRRLFEQAHQLLGSYCVVCSKPES